MSATMPAVEPITRDDRRITRRYAVLERLLTQVEAVRAEILSCGASGTPMPAERRRELEDAFEGLVATPQAYWELFTDEYHATVLRARRRVIANRPVGMIASTRK